MSPAILANLAVTKPVAVGIAIAAVVGLYLVFKVGKFILKTLLWLLVLGAIGAAAWWFFAAHHGSL